MKEYIMQFRSLFLVWLLVSMAMISTVLAQEGINRNPVDDPAFFEIAAYYEYDRPLPLLAEVLSTQTHDGRQLPYFTDKLHFRSIHDETVNGYFTYPRDTTATRYPTIVLLHSNNRYRGSHDTWTTTWLDTLSRQGYCVLAIDQYGFGERFLPDKAPDFYGDLGPYETRDVTIQHVVDARRAIDYLYTRSEVDTTRIALMGESMGSYNSCLVAGLEERLATTVLVVAGPWPSGATDDPLLGIGHMLNFASRISNPVLMVNAADDEYTTRGEVEELHAVITAPKKLVWHSSEHAILVRDQIPDILLWFDEHLK